MKKTMQEIYDIETNVPIPEGVRERVPLDRLEVGESIQFPLNLRSGVAALAVRIRKTDNTKSFRTKKLDEDNCRVWRTK